jgi:hypothetical protein
MSSEQTKIFLARLPKSLDEKGVKDLCSKYGEVKSVEMKHNYAYVVIKGVFDTSINRDLRVLRPPVMQLKNCMTKILRGLVSVLKLIVLACLVAFILLSG